MVRMIGTGINEQFLEHSAAQAILWQHTTNAAFNDGIVLLGLQVACDDALLTTWVAREGNVFLLLPLLTRKTDLFGIDDDYIIAGVYVWRVGRLVLSAQHGGNPGTKTAHYFAFGVDHVPLVLNRLLISRYGFITQRIHY